MKISLSQEWYKFRHQKGPIIGILFLVGVMLLMSVISKTINRNQIRESFGAAQWIFMIIIIISANFLIMEDQYGTNQTLFYKHQYRWSIYNAKLIILSLYCGVLTVISFGLSGLIKIVLAPQLSWFSYNSQGSHLLIDLLFGTGACFLVAIFILTFIFLLAVLIPINTVVISLGLILIFMGQSIASLTIEAGAGFSDLLKWQPFNMLNLISQLLNPTDQKITHLANYQLLLGVIGYTIFCYLLGYHEFKRKQV